MKVPRSALVLIPADGPVRLIPRRTDLAGNVERDTSADRGVVIRLATYRRRQRPQPNGDLIA